jgi:hypothetical protein
MPPTDRNATRAPVVPVLAVSLKLKPPLPAARARVGVAATAVGAFGPEIRMWSCLARAVSVGVPGNVAGYG